MRFTAVALFAVLWTPIWSACLPFEVASVDGSKCFLMFSHKTDWSRAARTCDLIGGRLASVESSADKNVIQNMAKKNFESDNQFWVGALHGCHTLHTIRGMVRTRSCGDELPYVCDRETFSSPATNATQPGQCESGWSEFQANCYLASTLRLTWQQAAEHCAQQGAHLASVHNEAEHNFLVKLSAKKRVYSSRIGGVAGKFYGVTVLLWTDGTKVEWIQEIRFGNGACVMLVDDEWITDECTTPFPFVCKKAKN